MNKLLREDKELKYSIILPIRNVRPYIESAVNSVLQQKYSDYELIISDNQSDDGTSEYIDIINHKNVRVLHTPRSFTIAEHFNWAQSHAVGTWQIYLGGDDALQPYFFTLADKLTAIAESKKIYAISSRRGYYFWNGCQATYGDTCIFYTAENKYKILSAKKEMYKALCGQLPCSYFDLPQMYTTSLFHKSLIENAKRAQKGFFLSPYSVQDAYLAAIAVLFSRKILRSEIPLGWVGTSPKTAFRESTWNNNFKLRIETGDFNIASCELYLWDAVLTLMDTVPQLKTKKIKSIFLKIKMFSFILSNIDSIKHPERYAALIKVIKINHCNLSVIKAYKLLHSFYEKQCTFIKSLFFFPWRCIRYFLKRILKLTHLFSSNNGCSIQISWSESPNMTMEKASEIIAELINTNIKIEKIKSS